HAPRAGATTTFFFGDDPRWLPQYAHVGMLRTLPVASKLPNRWGFFDMVGNVWEMCWDHTGPLPRELMFDPTPPPSGPHWVLRGGAYDSGSYDCPSSNRHQAVLRQPSLGLP